jgi:hypothetical protein
VTVPQVNACFVDGTADWTAVEANVTALLGEWLLLRSLRTVLHHEVYDTVFCHDSGLVGKC